MAELGTSHAPPHRVDLSNLLIDLDARKALRVRAAHAQEAIADLVEQQEAIRGYNRQAIAIVERLRELPEGKYQDVMRTLMPALDVLHQERLGDTQDMLEAG